MMGSMAYTLFLTPEARYAQALKRNMDDRAGLAGCVLENLEPSPDDGVDAA